MKELVKKITPKFILNWYHKTLAILAPVFYGFPSNKLIVIGITGTKGKSSTVYITAKMLESAGFKVGLTSTVMFKIGEKEWLNDSKMTMQGRFKLQKNLRKMVKTGCEYAVIETSSEGIAQYRHWGINYDVVVLTSLTPEHLEAHGGFENYRAAKMEIFKRLRTQKYKKVNGQRIPKIMVINADTKDAGHFIQFKADQKLAYKITDEPLPIGNFSEVEVYQAENIQVSAQGTKFNFRNQEFNLKLLGEFNVANVMAALLIGLSRGLSLKKLKQGVESVAHIPGRMEFIEEGQDFKVIVDYAHEPESMKQLYQFIEEVFKKADTKIIHVLGSAGGGRDKSRRPKLGSIAGRQADYIIVTDEDPYDEDPQEIINQVAQGALDEGPPCPPQGEAGKVLDKNLYKILNRRQAIATALSLAKKNDIVLITGKGSEQAMVVSGLKKIKWDDRVVAREEIVKLLKTPNALRS